MSAVVGNTIGMMGSAVSVIATPLILMVLAVCLLLASMFVPYYVDGTGMSTDVDKKCLGYTDKKNCDTMKALPIVTVILGLLTACCMGLLNIFPKYGTKMTEGFKGIMKKFRLTLPVLIILTTIFSVATLSTQLATPMSGSVSLADQSQKPCSANPITFKEGMALSSTSTVLFVFVFLLLVSKAEAISKLA